MVAEDRLFRFNVFHGLVDVGLEEWKEKEKIANSTQTYLENGETLRKVSLCVEKMITAQSQGMVTTT